MNKTKLGSSMLRLPNRTPPRSTVPLSQFPAPMSIPLGVSPSGPSTSDALLLSGQLSSEPWQPPKSTLVMQKTTSQPIGRQRRDSSLGSGRLCWLAVLRCWPILPRLTPTTLMRSLMIALVPAHRHLHLCSPPRQSFFILLLFLLQDSDMVDLASGGYISAVHSGGLR